MIDLSYDNSNCLNDELSPSDGDASVNEGIRLSLGSAGGCLHPPALLKIHSLSYSNVLTLYVTRCTLVLLGICAGFLTEKYLTLGKRINNKNIGIDSPFGGLFLSPLLFFFVLSKLTFGYLLKNQELGFFAQDTSPTHPVPRQKITTR